MSEVVSAIGPHSIGSDRHGYGPFCTRIAEAGRRLALVKCRDDFGAIDEPLALWPETVTIGAFTDFDRLPFDYAAFEKRALLNPRIRYWEVLNEEDAPSTYAAKADDIALGVAGNALKGRIDALNVALPIQHNEQIGFEIVKRRANAFEDR